MTPRLEDLPDVLTVREVADVLRVSQSTVYELVRRRRLRAVRCGIGRQGGVRITQSVLREYLGLPIPPRTAADAAAADRGKLVFLPTRGEEPPGAAAKSPGSRSPARPGRGSR
jgi:excisionase family DNA binding protein